MNRRGFLASLAAAAGGLLVAGDEARKAYSFIRKNPFALRGVEAWLPAEGERGPFFGINRVIADVNCPRDRIYLIPSRDCVFAHSELVRRISLELYS